MPTNLSVKNAPDEMVAALKARAARNRRSLQGEMMVILQSASLDAGVERDPGAVARDVVARLRQLGLETPAEAVGMVREDRER